MKKNKANPMTFERWVRSTIKEGTVKYHDEDGNEAIRVISHDNIINYPENHPSWVKIYEDYKTNI